MHSVRFVRRGWEAWHEDEVGGLALHDVGKLPQDFRHRVSVPDWSRTIHRRTKEEDGLHSGLADLTQDSQALGQDGLDMDRGSSGQVLRAGDEVRDTRQEANVALVADRLQGLGQGDQLSTWDNLTSGHQRTIAAVQRTHVTLDVGISNDRKTKRHFGNVFLERDRTENEREEESAERKKLKTAEHKQSWKPRLLKFEFLNFEL